MRILIVTGSSGGHIFPAVALAEALKRSNTELLLVLPQNDLTSGLGSAPAQIKYIRAVELSFKLNKKNIIGLYFFCCSAWESFKIILKFKPDAVVGFGSLNTVALVFWAWLFRIKTIIHEQNVVCGRANRILSKLVDKVAVSFSATGCSLNIAAEKIVLTGNPLRAEMFGVDKKMALEFFNFQEGKLTILVTGGSQGSHRLNAACFEALSGYVQKDKLQVIHICGKSDLAGLKEKYPAAGLAYQLFDFLPQMQYAYSACDLVVCRSGATTIAELQKFKIPAILIPYPFAYAHQLANAQELEKSGAALVIGDRHLTPERLCLGLTELLAGPYKLEAMRRAYAGMDWSDAAELLAREVLSAV
jgi:UDP-N-acetylglucosamine--N-acetylmuramyl-(pentapeptide) pyrophosphoryl-undecaprenol N-acetylglucosamine transferase